MNGFAIVVNFRLKAGAHAAFRRLVDANATASLKNERGCRRFDVLEALDQPDQVLLYEIYDNEAAFDDHCKTAHFLRFDTESEALVEAKSVYRYALVCGG